jgi:hypothetical protein
MKIILFFIHIFLARAEQPMSGEIDCLMVKRYIRAAKLENVRTKKSVLQHSFVFT